MPKFKLLSPKLLVILVLCLFANNLQATVLSSWSGSGFSAPFSATGGSLTSGASLTTSGTGASAFSSSVGFPSDPIYACNNWNVGSGNAWWLLTFSTTGYTSITMDYKFGTFQFGPKDFKMQYSTSSSSGPWTDFGLTFAFGSVGASGVLNSYTGTSLPAACNNQSTVWVRFVTTSAPSSTGGSIIDDITINGTASGSAPSITTNPSNTSTCSGNSASFTVAASNSPTSYTWQVNTGSGYTNISNGGVYSNATTATLNITGATAGMNGYLYRANATNGSGSSSFSTAATLTVNSAPFIITDPSNLTSCAGSGSFVFSVSAGGAGLTYQWQQNTGSGFVNMAASGGTYSGGNSNVLVFVSINSGMSGYQYRCVVSGSCTPSATSASATLTVNPTPAITTNPSNYSTCSGNNASFSVVASNSPTGYTWQVNTGSGYTNISNGGVYSNATTATLNITGATAGMNGYLYRAIATNGCGSSAASTAATLTVGTTPTASFTATPGSTSCTNTDVTYTTVSGQMAYNWVVPGTLGVDYSITSGGVGSSSSTVTLKWLTTGSKTVYIDHQNSSGCWSAVSASSATTVSASPTPTFTASPAGTICTGVSVTYTTQSGQSNYIWSVPGTVGVDYTIISGGIGTSSNTVTLQWLTAGSKTVTVNYNNVAGCTGSSAASATNTVIAAPVILSGGGSSSICVGANVTFTVSASNTPTSYQWQVSTDGGGTWSDLSNGGVYSNVTTFQITITGATVVMNNYQYRVYATNSCGSSSPGSVRTLLVNNGPTISSNPSNSVICAGSNASFTIAAINSPLNYQWQESQNGGSTWANLSNGGVYSTVTSTTLNITGATASMNGYRYRAISGNGCGVSSPSAAAVLTVKNITWYQDNDGDGFGNPSVTQLSCTKPTGYVLNNLDCNDASANTGQWTNVGGSAGISAGTAQYTACAFDASNNLYVVYRDVANGNKATVMKYDGTSWTTLGLAFTPGTADRTSIAVDASGAPYICYTDGFVGNKLSVLKYSGGIWTFVGGVAGFTASSGTHSDIQFDKSNTPYVAFSDGSVGNKVSLMKYNGSSWVYVGGAGFTAGIGDHVHLAFDAQGFPYVSFRDYNASLLTTVMKYDGSTWSILGSAGISVANSDYTDLAIDDNNNVYSGHFGAGGGGNYVQVKKYSGGTWTNISTGFTVTTFGGYPSLDIDAGNTLYLGYYDNIYSPGKAIVRSYNGSSWTTIGPAGFSASYTLFASLKLNSYGIPYMAYSDQGNSNKLTVMTYGPVATATTPSVSATSTTICNGASTTLSITSGTLNDATAWKWYSGSCGGTLVGTGTSVIVSPTTTTTYYVRGEGTCPGSTGSCATVTVTVNQLPAIVTDPVDVSLITGNNASFSVTATGTGIGYQWQQDSGSGFVNLTNGGVYSGVTTNTLNITPATLPMNSYYYRCVVTGTCSPAVTSTPAILRVDPLAPVITTQPISSSICQGSNTSFTIVAANSPTSYTWQVNTGSGYVNIANGGVYSGANTATLTITGPTTAMSGYLYRAFASNVTGNSPFSNDATLTVNVPPTISVNPANASVCVGVASVVFSITASNPGGTYQWQADNGSGFANVSNGGFYSGATTTSLTVTAPTAALNGYIYRCIATGFCSPIATSTGATLTVRTLPAISTNPSNSTICAGDNTSFSVVATGTSITYQWQVDNGSGFANISNGGFYSGATTNSLAITAATTALNGFIYRCVVSGSCTPAATSASATLIVNSLPAISANPVSSTICVGANTSFAITASGTGASYQWQVDNGSGFSNVTNGGVYSGATTNTLALTAPTAAMSGSIYRCIVSGTCAPAATSTSALLTVNTLPAITTQPVSGTICAGNNISFVISATGTAITYQWQVDNGGGFVNVANGGVYSGVTTNALAITGGTVSMNGYVYRCVVSGTCTPAAVSSSATLTVNSLPAITANPASLVVCPGTPVSFNISATGTGISYQWQFSTNGGGTWSNLTNTTPYSGVNTTTLSLSTTVTPMNGYMFRCFVAGTCTPSVVSGSATLTINALPAISSQPSDAAICIGGNTAFTVGATGAGITYQWQVNNGSGYADVVNGGIYSGATTPTLSVTGVTLPISGYLYRAVISGTCPPSAISAPAQLIVTIPPAITVNPVDMTTCEGTNTVFQVAASGSGLTYQWQVNTGSGFVNIINSYPYTGATLQSLTVLGTPAVLDGAIYRVVVSGTCPPAVISSPAKLSVLRLPAIVSLSALSVTSCPGAAVTFSVNATGSGLGYRWQVNSGSGFVNVPNTSVYSGINNDTLTITPTTAMNGYQYRVVVSGSCLPSVTSSTMTLNVYNPVQIVSQSKVDSACEGWTAKLGVSATGGGLRYQWQIKSGTGYVDLTNIPPYSGVTTDSLRLTGIPGSLNGAIFRCAVTETIFCNITLYTEDISLRVKQIPTVVPAEAKVAPLTDVTFSVPDTLTGYQWQVNKNLGAGFVNLTDGPQYSGSNTYRLTVKQVDLSMSSYVYRCIVYAGCNLPLVSTHGVLIVLPQTSVTNTTLAGMNYMTVYPNPTSSELNVMFDKPVKGTTQIVLLNKLGQTIRTYSRDLSRNGRTAIDVSELPSGVYSIQLINNTDNINTNTRFTKQ